MKYNIIRVSSIVTVCFLVVGCASKWQHPIKDEKDLVTDKYKCTQESTALYPPLFLSSPFQAGYMYPTINHYTAYGYGRFRRDYYFPPAFTWQDYNEPARMKAFNSCLNTLGWEWIFKW
ncbi:MAG: hypothetical protein PHQ22_09835 [Sulfuricurvum sp.]|nr:hypothetical protein [Sulfuricurvum sp.]MDD5387479.1 hypothetical protein [Sulfuricurvum sp.]